MPEPKAPGGTSAHVDTFAADHLPPRAEWPPMDYGRPTELAKYPDRMNCAEWLLDRRIEKFGQRPVLRTPDTMWTYAELRDVANRIANVLVDELGVQPGNRVLMRSPNNPMTSISY